MSGKTFTVLSAYLTRLGLGVALIGVAGCVAGYPHNEPDPTFGEDVKAGAGTYGGQTKIDATAKTPGGPSSTAPAQSGPSGQAFPPLPSSTAGGGTAMGVGSGSNAGGRGASDATSISTGVSGTGLNGTGSYGGSNVGGGTTGTTSNNGTTGNPSSTDR